jgi:EmrB/QacA subfamily drug resistance transporter
VKNALQPVDTRAALVLLCAVQFMIVLDGTIINVALAEIRSGLSITQLELQWVVNAYVLAYGGFLLLGGRAADIFGHRRVFRVGVVLFAIASLAGGLAPNGTSLIAARALQGGGGAMATPAALSLVASLFPGGPERARAFGTLGAIAAAGAASGVLLGGVLTGFLGWRWVLLVNVPIGLGVAILAPYRLPAIPPLTHRPSLDVAGAASVTVALVLLVLGIVGGSTYGWLSARTVGLVGTAVALLVLFVVIESRSAAPLVNLRIFANMPLVRANCVGLAHASGPITVMYFLSQHLQRSLGYSPLQTGIAFLPMAIVAGVGAALASRLMRRHRPERIMSGGLLLMATGLAFLAPLSADGGYILTILPGILMVGAGITLAAVPMTIAAVSSVSPEETGVASGLLNTSQQVGAAVTLAILVAMTGTAPDASFQPAFIGGFAVLVIGAALGSFLQVGSVQPK